MIWKSNYIHPKGWIFKIDHDFNVGYYLYVCNEQNRDTHDHLQDSLEMAKEQALEDFGVPLNSWVETDEAL